MDNILRLIDALRERGAIKIALPEVTVEFASPVVAATSQFEDSEPVIERTLTPAELESFMYVETSKM